jgi:dihydroorotase
MISATGMSTLIRQATIADPRSPLNGQKVDIFIKNGVIEQIAPTIETEAAETIAGDNLIVTPGFTDIFSHFCDPGLEHKETLETGTAAALKGGYTRILTVPNTKPVVHNKSQVEYVVQKSKHLKVDIIPIGAITQNCEGKELAEMHDMHASGAVAFSDGLHPVQNSQVLLKALQYVKAFNGIVIQVPDEQNLSRTGLVNEGIVSTRLGLPGKPALAETLMLARDIELLRYTGSKLHFTGISTAASVELIRRAKNDGLQVTCSVSPYHLWFSDEDLADYDTNLKVNPPLRTPEDVQALRNAVFDGTIDCIASHHQPHDWDSKVCEFEYAKYGMEGLESCFAATATVLPQLSAERLAELFAIHPSDIFGLTLPVIEEGAKANMTVYQKGVTKVFDENNIASKSKNNALIGKTLHYSIMKTII